MQIWQIEKNRDGKAKWIKQSFTIPLNRNVKYYFSKKNEPFSLADMIRLELTRNDFPRYIVFNHREEKRLDTLSRSLLLQNTRSAFSGELLSVICNQIRNTFRGSFHGIFIPEDPNKNQFEKGVKLRIAISIQ